MGNAEHPTGHGQTRTAPTEPVRAADPSGNVAPAATATAEAPSPTPAAPEGGQQEAEFSATQEDTELVAQANALCLAVQYDSAPLAEARAALGARLAFPPLDFDSIKRDIQKVHEAIAKQAEADDVPPQAKSLRPET